MKYRLVGARKFLEIAKPGTLFIPLEVWEYTAKKEEKLNRIIEEFKQNPRYVYDINWDHLHIFVNNGGSITFYYDAINCNEEDNYIYYYDYNVVGDADPEHTLYLIVDSIEDIPDYIDFWCHEDRISKAEFPNDIVIYDDTIKRYVHYLHLTKGEIKELHKSILNNECREVLESSNEWAKNELAKRDNPILALDIEVEV